MKKKRSDSSKCSVGSVGSASALSLVGDRDKPSISIKKISGTIPANPMSDRQPFILEDFYKARKPRKSKLAPALRSGRQGLKVAPTIRAEHHNTDDVHFVASGQTTMTDTPAKSTVKGSEKKNSSRETSERSEQARYLNMNYLLRDFPVKLFPLRDHVKVLLTKQGELFSSKYAELLEVKDLATYSLRMLKDYFHTTTGEPSQSYSFRWMNLGTMSNGNCLTLNIGYPKTVKGSLSSLLEETVNKKYYISKAMLQYIEDKTHHEVPISNPEEELKSPLRSQGDKPMTADPVIVDFLHARREGKARIYKEMAPSLNQRDYKEPRCVMEEGELKQVGNIDEKGHNSLWGRVYSPEGLAANINADGGGLGAKTGLYIANTVDQDGYLRRGTRDRNKNGKAVLTSIPKRRIRRLTPRECERLQGFPDDWTLVVTKKGDAGECYDYEEGTVKIKGKIMSDTQRYKQMGNAVSVPVITAIGEAILKTIK